MLVPISTDPDNVSRTKTKGVWGDDGVSVQMDNTDKDWEVTARITIKIPARTASMVVITVGVITIDRVIPTIIRRREEIITGDTTGTQDTNRRSTDSWCFCRPS